LVTSIKYEKVARLKRHSILHTPKDRPRLMFLVVANKFALKKQSGGRESLLKRGMLEISGSDWE